MTVIEEDKPLAGFLKRLFPFAILFALAALVALLLRRAGRGQRRPK
ncbi:MAG: hypothetical protein HYX97_03880 [Chloroflexi bacterium]|nr:hypothetical protein [Chloroflexota bacterium]